MKFGAPSWLVVLPIVITVLVAFWIWSMRRAQVALRAAFNTPLLTRLVRSVNHKRRWLKRGLLVLGIASLVLALARPQWGRAEVEIERTGVDLVIALDVSRSMLAVDSGGTNRLNTAIVAIERLLETIGGDRVGLVAFAGEAYMLAPLTRDHVAVERALSFAGPAMISEQGSNLGEAIKRSRECFDRGAAGPRALLIVSDGEQLQGDAMEAARNALRAGIKVHTAGLGSASGTRVPVGNRRGESIIHNDLGREVVSRRDEQNLQRIAQAGGGLYTRVDETDSPALVAWFQRAAATLTRSTEKRLVDEPRERFQWPLALALGILAVEWLIGDRSRRSSKQ